MRFALCAQLCFGVLLATVSSQAQTAHDYLANNVVLIVRHAEKPETGAGLTAQGEARSRAYVRYFQNFHDGDLTFSVDGLYAGADSPASMRPRLTLEPLHAATGLTLHSNIGTKDAPLLVQELRETSHGMHPLIAWRHGQIPALLDAFGAPKTLIPTNKWPDDVYDWVVVLTFDAQGKLASERLIHENLNLAPK